MEGNLLKWIEDFLMNRRTRVRVNGSFSEWFDVISGVPQGSVLGPLLFIIFVNDLPKWITSSINMFADDTKLWAVIKKKEDAEELQLDLDRIMEWTNKWLLKLNPDKCKVMHIGKKDNRNDYVLKNSNGNTKLTETTEERDLGILVRSDLRPSSQCASAAAKASAVMGLVKRHFKNMDQEDFLIMYKTYIRPRMEYCIQVWSPHLAKDIQLLERVQRKSTKLVRGFQKLSYQDRLKRLDLTTLEERRKRGDLIEVYKLLHRKENIGYEQFFKLAKAETSRYDLRGHSMKLFHNRTRLDTRKFYFSQRVVSPWNNLPQHVVDAPSVNRFKNVYDRFMNQDMDN